MGGQAFTVIGMLVSVRWSINVLKTSSSDRAIQYSQQTEYLKSVLEIVI